MTDKPETPKPEAEADNGAATPAAKPAAKSAAKKATAKKAVAKKAAAKAASAEPAMAKDGNAKTDAPEATPPSAATSPPPSPSTKPAPTPTNNNAFAAAWPGVAAGVISAILVVLIGTSIGFIGGGQNLRAELDQLSSETERLALAGGDPEAIGRLQVRLDGMEDDLRALNMGAARSSDLSAAQARIAALEAQGTGQGGGAGFDASGLEQSMRSLDGRLDVLEANTPSNLQARLNALVASTDFAALEARVETLEDDQLAQDMRRAAMALALAQLSRAALGSEPFAAELEALSALRPNDPLVAQLRPSALVGISTQAMLASEFNTVRRQVVAADRATKYDGFLSGVWHWLVGLVTFQRTGQIEGDSVDAILARASLRLQENNLPAVVAEMASLPETVRDPARDWLTMAAARVSLDRLITALSTEVIGELEQ